MSKKQKRVSSPRPDSSEVKDWAPGTPVPVEEEGEADDLEDQCEARWSEASAARVQEEEGTLVDLDAGDQGVGQVPADDAIPQDASGVPEGEWGLRYRCHESGEILNLGAEEVVADALYFDAPNSWTGDVVDGPEYRTVVIGPPLVAFTTIIPQPMTEARARQLLKTAYAELGTA